MIRGLGIFQGRLMSRLRHKLIPPPSALDLRRALGAWRDDLYFPEWKMGFITVPKAANTSLKYLLLDTLDPDIRRRSRAEITAVGDEQRIHKVLRESPYRCTAARLTEKDVDYICAPVRNPVGRLVSFYFDKVVGRGWPASKQAEMAALYGFDSRTSFDDFVAVVADLADEECEPHFRSQYNLVGPKIVADARFRLIRTENFERDYHAVSEEIGLPIGEVGKRNPAHYDSFEVSPATLAMIERRFASDYELFYRDSL